MAADNEYSLQKLFEEAASELADHQLREELRRLELGVDAIEIPRELVEEEKELDLTNLSATIHELKFPQKLKLAMHGNMTARTLLIRDKNRLVPLFVLNNPRITDNEIVEFSRNTNLDDSVLRAIARNGTWTKNYQVKINLVSNPKAPIDIALRWVPYLKEKDLRFISKSKNVPQIVATQCRKLLEKREKSES